MATTLATVRADDASELEACRRIAGYDNGIALLQERDTLQARVLTLEAALREIRDGRLPQVCALYELCTHEGCAASYAAFAIAENALAPGAGGPP